MNINPMVVDLYHGDSVSSFEAARQFGIRGVIHKATEGLTDADRAYDLRRHDAARASLLWGAYHFMHPGDPVAQADRFVNVAEPDPQTLLALDHEDEKVPLADAIKFMRAVEARIGRKVLFYSGFLIKEQIATTSRKFPLDTTPAADRAYLAGHRLWLSHYSATPVCPIIWQTAWLWQFTGDGVGPFPHCVPGLRGHVDVNSFAGTADELAAQWAGEVLAAEVA